MIHEHRTPRCGRNGRTNPISLWTALAAALLAGAAAAPEPHGAPEGRGGPVCRPLFYRNFTEPATGAPACRISENSSPCSPPYMGLTCGRESWYCPEDCGDPARRKPTTCDNPGGSPACRIATNGLTTSSWTANMTVGEEGGACYFVAAAGLYKGPPYSRSVDFGLFCNSTAPCRWDLLAALRKGSSKAGPSAWVIQAGHILVDPKDRSADVGGQEACRAAMSCPPLGALLSSGPEVDYGGTQFVCIPNDDAFREGLLVRRDGLGRAACLTDGSGSCMTLPGSCCGVLGRLTAARNGLSSTTWPAIACPPGEPWCARALAATAGMRGPDLAMGYNCTFRPVGGMNYTQDAPDPGAGPWTVVRRTPGSYDPETPGPTYGYRILRRTGNGSIACMGYKLRGLFEWQGTCLLEYLNSPEVTDAGCAVNLARTAPADVYWKVMDRRWDRAYTDPDILWRLGMDPARPLPGSAPPDPPRPPARGAWTCVQLCGESGDRILARYHGTGGGVQCKGPDAGRCSFYRDSACTLRAPGEPEPHPSGEVGYVCSLDDQEAGWCARAAAAVVPWGTGVADCAPQEIRAPCNGTCSPSGSCVRYGGSSFCLCNDGFFGDGVTCRADPCANNNGGCSPQATCAPSAGGPVCTCWEGYLGDGSTCLPDPCFHNGGCDSRARCTRTGPSSRTCTCTTGFVGNGTYCEDACLSYPCAANAACFYSTYTNGPRCQCLGGYTGDGRVRCKSKCLTRNGGCSANATCSVVPGGGNVACACKPAFYGNGFTCRAKGVVRLSVSGPASARRGRRVAISAKALNAAGRPVAKLVIQFQLGSGSKVNGTTNAAGTASASYLVPAKAALGKATVVARFLGTTTLLATSARRTLTVVR
ncbi:hypothetical protein DFJ74DRAFT_763685 [Hyaloraphidium curvatum]|nr:hypothetical protein DFJ74DRAFT_763685 [Hyaloraphidium curvatum]